MAEYIEREALMKNFCGYDLTKCVKYGNKDAGQQRDSYSTMMMYEIADEIMDAPAAYVAPISDVYFSKSSLLADLDWLESVGCKSMEIQVLRERLEYGAVKPACDIVRAAHGKNDNDGGMNCVKG